MVVGKGVGGWYFNSQALVADAWHALSDTLSDILTLATVSWSLKPPTERFPAGYGKIESLGGLAVSGLLLGGGALMGWSSAASLLTQFGIDFELLGGLIHMHSHGHSHGALGPSLNAAWLAGGSIVIKEWLYRASMSCSPS
jgi:divalent metal cation (Fe/Co/Zn/Cd) transporter